MPRPALDLSIVIPVAPGADPAPAIAAVSAALPRGVTAELLTVVGRHPTRQRNLAALRARGRVLYFLDHDALVDRGTLARLLGDLRRGAAAAGGPNGMTRTGAFADAVDGSLASPVAAPLVGSRYVAGGTEPRPATERDLILCNLAVDRASFVAARGFDARLYPNEENELVNRLRAAGRRVTYDPAAGVRKPRPADPWRLARETFRYGVGRGRQVWINPFAGDWPFVLAALGLAAWLAACVREAAWLRWLVPYAAVVGAESARLAAWRPGTGGGAARAARLFAAIVIRHWAYGLGLLAGLATGWRARRVALPPMAFRFRRFLRARGGFRLASSDLISIGVFAVKEA